jgi:hypothetical protein
VPLLLLLLLLLSVHLCLLLGRRVGLLLPQVREPRLLLRAVCLQARQPLRLHTRLRLAALQQLVERPQLVRRRSNAAQRVMVLGLHLSQRVRHSTRRLLMLRWQLRGRRCACWRLCH